MELQQPRMRWLLTSLCFLFLLSLPPVSYANANEGNALIQMMRAWKVSFPSWMEGQDPCNGTWTGVTCAFDSVTSLILNNEGLTGPMPPQIGQLSSLTYLDLGNFPGGRLNSITGQFPNEFSNLTRLQTLNMTYNVLRVPFPTVLLTITSLVTLRIDNAGLTGQLPVGMKALQNLQLLYLGNNTLTGPLPSDLAQLSELQELSLWGNKFNEPLPSEWSALRSLTYLNLHDCALLGGLPPTFSSLTNLQRLNLKGNSITGHIPDPWQSMTSLEELLLNLNFISGSLPSWLLKLPNLTTLDLSKNQLQNNFVSPLDTGRLTFLSLQCNFLSGSQPIVSSNVFPPLNESIVRWNCFEGQVDSDRVYGCSRPPDCTDFQKSIKDGCPPCPSNQGGIPEVATCICLGDKPIGTKDSSSFPILAVLGGAAGLVLLAIVAITLLFWWKQKEMKSKDTDVFSTAGTNKDLEEGTCEIPKDVQKYSFNELSKASDKFDDSHVIGSGGFGKVFFGTLADGKMVAIKKASDTGTQGRSEFHNEVGLLSRLHHRHLVRLEGYCDDNGLQILVYEFMKNGNLHEYISGKHGNENILGWYKRLEIAIGVAQGLEYLHSFANPPVIHRDVKPSNILLDENFVAKVADFGISKATPEFDTHISTRPAGTAGFLDPQYFVTRQLTTASDVYSYGVVLLELITGQQAIDHHRNQHNIIEWARPRFAQGGVPSIIDPFIQDGYSVEAYTAMAKIALECASFEKNLRPTMKTVLSVLEPFVNSWSSTMETAPTPGKAPAPTANFQFTHSFRSWRGCISGRREESDTNSNPQVETNMTVGLLAAR